MQEPKTWQNILDELDEKKEFAFYLERLKDLVENKLTMAK